TRI
ncbi:hypothetical protein CP8484711_0795B, partial [Chlamydia psittaci 84-8471/1]